MRPTEELLRRRVRLPLDRGFTSAEALAAGVTRKRLRNLVAEGLVRCLITGVYAVADLELTVLVRARAIALVVPPNTVVADETAAWIHGVDLLDHRGGLPRLSFVRIHGDTRLRREGVASGTRMFVGADLMYVEGVCVTTPLRTAIDLGRRLRPERALGAIDGLLRTRTFTIADLERELPRFKGFRGVVLLRALVPMADARSESPAESRLRYSWLMSSDLPWPELQIPIENPHSTDPWRFDLGVEALRYALEYDGQAFHDTSEQKERDRRKRDYARDHLGWTVDVMEKQDVYGSAANPMAIVRQSIRTARLNLGLPASEWRWPRG